MRRSTNIQDTRMPWQHATRPARQLAHTIVRAPFAGIVTNVPSLQPGQLPCRRGNRIQHRLDRSRSGFRRGPKETELTYVKPGQKVTVEVDTFPGQRWAGTVESHKPRGPPSSFSLLPGREYQRATGSRWSQRIPMRVRVHNAPGKPALRVGMSVEVSVDTGHERGLPSFITDLFGSSDFPNVADNAPNDGAADQPAPRLRCVSSSPLSCKALDTTIANVALPYMQGSVSAERGSDQLGADFLYRGAGSDHDAAVGFSCKQVRPQSASSWVAVVGFRDCIRAVRHCAIRLVQIVAFPIAAGVLRRSAGSALASPYSARPSIRLGRTRGLPWPCSGGIGDGGASAGAG